MSSARATQILTDVMDDARTSSGVADLPDLLVDACSAALPVTGVGLVWMTEQGPGSMLAATDWPARILEELQFTLGEGPCVDSSVSGATSSASRPDAGLPRALAGLSPGCA